MSVQLTPSRALSALQITPLIDIVFLLLLFFLVASRFAAEDREMDVQLPSASEAQPLIVEAQELFLHIDREQRIFLEGQQVSEEQLESKLKQMRRDRPSLMTVILRADRRCTWDVVASAVNACHLAGIHDVRPTTIAEARRE